MSRKSDAPGHDAAEYSKVLTTDFRTGTEKRHIASVKSHYGVNTYDKQHYHDNHSDKIR